MSIATTVARFEAAEARDDVLGQIEQADARRFKKRADTGAFARLAPRSRALRSEFRSGR